MKLHLFINGMPRTGYLNLSPFGDNDQVKLGTYRDLDGFVENNECLEILADTILDYVPFNELSDLFKSLLQKLRKNGKIIIGGTDLSEVCRAYHLGIIDTNDTNKLLHGEQTGAWAFKHAQLTLIDCVQGLQQLGLKINKKRLDGFHFVVEAQRI